jgi:hypothetical protein
VDPPVLYWSSQSISLRWSMLTYSSSELIFVVEFCSMHFFLYSRPKNFITFLEEKIVKCHAQHDITISFFTNYHYFYSKVSHWLAASLQILDSFIYLRKIPVGLNCIFLCWIFNLIGNNDHSVTVNLRNEHFSASLLTTKHTSEFVRTLRKNVTFHSYGSGIYFTSITETVRLNFTCSSLELDVEWTRGSI